MAGSAVLANVSTSTCYLTTPEFSLSLSDASATPLQVNSAPLPLTAKTLMRPGNAASFAIVWSNWCQERITQPANLVITLPEFSSKIISPLKDAGGSLLTAAPRCDNAQASSTLTIKKSS